MDPPSGGQVVLPSSMSSHADDADAAGDPHPVEPTVQTLTGHPLRPWTTWLEDRPEVFAH